jgi:hypothetical protein
MPSVSFRVPIDVTLQLRPESVAVGDFNGDGNADVAEPSILTGIDYSSAFVPVLPGDGAGNVVDAGGGFTPGFATGVMFEPFSTHGVTVGDFNADGRQDVAVADGINGVVRVALGLGDGKSFDLADPVVFGPGQPASKASSNSELAAGDLNGDGRLDLLATDGTQLYVLLGNGDGTFTPGANYANVGLGELAAADFDGDGRADAAYVGASGVGGVTVRLAAPDGTLGKPIALADTGVRGLTQGDFNKDGKPDLAAMTGDAAAANVSVFVNNGSDGAFSRLDLDAKLDGLDLIVAGDFNGDGNADLAAVASRDTGGNGVYEVFAGNGDATFQAGQAFTEHTVATSKVAAADFNKDGKSDLVFTKTDGQFTGGVRLFLAGEDAPPPTLAATLTATLPPALLTGGKVKGAKVALNVTNVGDAALAEPVTVKLFASDGSTLSDEDQISVARKKLKLGVGESKAIALKVAKVPQVASGEYHLVAELTGASVASVRATTATTVTISTPIVDLSGVLAGGARLPDSLARGQTLTLPVTLTNHGNSPINRSVDVSVDFISNLNLPPDGPTVVLPPLKIRKLAANSSRSAQLRVTIPSDTPPGTYFLGVFFDSSSALAESNESNNTFLTPVAIPIT